MMSLSAIRSISRDAAIKAARDNRIPFTVEPEDKVDWVTRRKKQMPFPFLGDYVPQGWKRTEREEMFVDSSGWGQRGEPALTLTEFLESLTPGKAYAITEAGQFQVYVAEYERDDSSKGNEAEYAGKLTADEELEADEILGDNTDQVY